MAQNVRTFLNPYTVNADGFELVHRDKGQTGAEIADSIFGASYPREASDKRLFMAGLQTWKNAKKSFKGIFVNAPEAHVARGTTVGARVQPVFNRSTTGYTRDQNTGRYEYDWEGKTKMPSMIYLCDDGHYVHNAVTEKAKTAYRNFVNSEDVFNGTGKMRIMFGVCIIDRGAQQVNRSAQVDFQSLAIMTPVNISSRWYLSASDAMARLHDVYMERLFGNLVRGSFQTARDVAIKVFNTTACLVVAEVPYLVNDDAMYLHNKYVNTRQAQSAYRVMGAVAFCPPVFEGPLTMECIPRCLGDADHRVFNLSTLVCTGMLRAAPSCMVNMLKANAAKHPAARGEPAFTDAFINAVKRLPKDVVMSEEFRAMLEKVKGLCEKGKDHTILYSRSLLFHELCI